MRKQVTRVSVLQTSKVIALFYVLISFLYWIAAIPMIVFGGGELKIMGFVYLAMPILMGVFGFLMILLSCAIYNLVAKWVGGVEFTVTDVDSAPQ